MSVALLFVGNYAVGQTVVTHTFAGTSGPIDSNISFSTAKNSGTTNPAFNTGDNTLRLYYSSTGTPYHGCSITLSPSVGVTITAVELYGVAGNTPVLRYTIGAATVTALDPTIPLSLTTYSISGLNVTSSIKIRNANTSNLQGRFTGIKVTYTVPATGPTVTTVAANSITTTSAALNGTINANGFTTDASFEYGTTAAYGLTITATPASVTGSTSTSIAASLGSLALNTQYFYRAVGTVSATPTNGAGMSFYTLAATPGVLVVSNPTQNTLDVAVNATTQNSNPAATLYAIQETSGQYVQANGTLGATAVWQTAATWATVTVTGLSSSTLYTFQTKARNGATVPVETIFGATASGTTTLPDAPVVTAGAPTGTYNFSFSYAISASNTATSYALSSGTLPLGLSLNTTTGVISGTPTEVGIFNTNFTASNAGGTSAPAAITITINKANQTITFAALSAVTYGDASFALTGSSDSSLAISYTSSDTNVATVLGTSVTIVGPGITTIEATQPGNANYNAAVAVGRTLTVNKKTVTISGLVADNKVQDGNSLATLSGTASIVGVINSDDVILNGIGIGTFASSAPGIGIAVSVNGYSLSGVDSANYTLTQPTGLTADITALDAPVATAATAVGVTSFTANWDAVLDATSYEIDVYEETIVSANTIIETFTAIGGGTSSSYSTRSWTGEGAVNWTAYNSRTDQIINVGDDAICLRDQAGAYLESDVISGGLSNLSFDVAQAFSGSGGILTIKVLTGPTFSTVTTIGTKSYTTSVSTYNSGVISGISGDYKILIENNAFARPVIDNLSFTSVSSLTNTYVINAMNVGDVTTYGVTGLNANTTYHYRVRAVLVAATSVNSNVIAVTTADDTCVWSSLAWSNVTGPTEEIEATIADAYDTATYGEITTKKLTIDTAGSLVISSGTNAYVLNEVVNNGTSAAAALVIENNANLVQINNTTNTGNITVHRETSELIRLDYVLWSSPVDGQFLQAFSPATLSNRFYTYDAGTNLYAVVASPSTTSFSSGTGYLIRTPNNHPTTPTIWSSTFAGFPHNGDVSLAVANDTYNAIGNPYPSTLDADAFMADNSISEALYFWRKVNNSANPSYATYTLSGGVANSGGGSALVPTYAIQVGQGFIAKSTSTSLNFTNSMRVADNDNLFLKSSNTVDRSRLWLDLTNTDGLFCQTLIAYMSSATSGVDSRIDGRIFSQPANGATLTSIIGNDSSYIIQGKGTFVDTDVVPLAFKTAVSGNFTIALSNVDGLFANNAQDVFLKDNLTNTITNLTNGDYTFATAIGDFLNRFEVVYQSTVLNTDNFTSNNLVVYTQTNSIVINAGSDLISNVKVFDVRGRLLLEKANLNDSEVVLNISKSNEVLLVQVTNQYGNVITKKVIK